MVKEKQKKIYLPLPSGYSYDPTMITKSISSGLSILGRDMKIVWMNKAQEGWFEPLDSLKGKYCYEVYEKRNKICPGCPSVKVFKYGLNQCVSLRKDITVSSGEKKHFKLTASPIRDKKGKIIQVLELVEDVTQQTVIENQVKKKLGLVSKELDFIARIDREFIFSHHFSLDKVLKESVGIASTLLNSKICNLRLVNGSKNMLISKASKGLSRQYKKNVVMKVGEGIAGKVAATKEPTVIKDLLTREKLKFRNELRAEGIRSLICVPIVLQDEILGTITVYDKKIGSFSKSDCQLLSNFANHIAILIDNVRSHKRIFVSYINTIKSLVSAVEARDMYTRGHSEKVTKLALDIANVMGLPKSEKVILSYCGRLHDIGKIAISDSILNKPGRLTFFERKEIEMHPVKGVDILSNLGFMESGIPIIKHHHERYDGRGYPDGLKGKQIPFLARIIVCVDAFDAMMSDRPYRPRMELEKALSELAENKKTQFDPEIVDVFTDIVKKKEISRQ